MSRVRIIFLLVGLALLGWVLHQADLGAVFHQVRAVGWGIVPILFVYAAAYLVDTVSWGLTLLRPLTPSWIRRLWVVRLVGSAVNKLTPLVGLGGEPVKAMMLKRRDHVPYRVTTTSLIAWETTNLFAGVVFSGLGLFLALRTGLLPPELQTPALVGLGVLLVAAGGFLASQRLQAFSRLLRPLARYLGGRRLLRVLRHLRDIESRLNAFYKTRRGHVAGVFLFSLVHQTLLAFEAWLTLRFLGTPVTPAGAWAIGAMGEIIRVGTFFIPANLGTLEGGLTLITTPLTGNPTAGLSLAVVRRFRDLVFIVWGLALGWRQKEKSPRRNGGSPRGR